MNDTGQAATGRAECQGKNEQWTVEGVPQMIRSAGAGMGEGPNVIVLACRWRYFAGRDLEGLKRLASEVDYRVVRMPCSAEAEGGWIAEALGSWADAVMVMGGHNGCPFAGDQLAAERSLKEKAAREGADPQRMVVDWGGGRTRDGLQGSVDRLIDTVRTDAGPR